MYLFPGTGLPRVAEALRRRAARSARSNPDSANVWIDDFCGNLFFCCDLSEHMGSQVYFRGSYSTSELIILQKLLSPDGVFLDAGANQGEFTVCAAARAYEGQVHAFEPVAGVRARLERNIARNAFENVTVHDFGLSDQNLEDVPIYGGASSFPDGTHNIGLASLFALSGRDAPLSRVRLRRLDDHLPEDQRVDVIKVDVEGAELAVLKGAEATILRERPAIIFEANEKACQAAGYSVTELVKWLQDRNFELWRIGKKGELVQMNDSLTFCNVLAMPGERPELSRLARVA